MHQRCVGGSLSLVSVGEDAVVARAGGGALNGALS